MTNGLITALRRKPRMRRVEPPAPLRLSASQREVLELLHEFNFATPRLIAQVYGSRAGRGGRGYWHLLRELRHLFDAGLVHRFPRTARTLQAGSQECIYC